MARDGLHHGVAAIHWNEQGSKAVVLGGLLACICGIDSIDFDRYVTSDWGKVTCKRCRRHKSRLDRFRLRPEGEE